MDFQDIATSSKRQKHKMFYHHDQQFGDSSLCSMNIRGDTNALEKWMLDSWLSMGQNWED